MQRPTDMALSPDGYLVVTEFPWRAGQLSGRNGRLEQARPARVSVLDLAGRAQARFGSGTPGDASTFAAPHGVAVDSSGDIYIAEVTYSLSHSWLADSEEERRDLAQRQTLRKFVRSVVGTDSRHRAALSANIG